MRLKRLTSPDETQRLYYNKVSMGEMRPPTVVFKASEIYAKIYGLPPVLYSKFSLEEVSGSILRVINSYDNR